MRHMPRLFFSRSCVAMEAPQRKVHIKYPIHLGAPRHSPNPFLVPFSSTYTTLTIRQWRCLTHDRQDDLMIVLVVYPWNIPSLGVRYLRYTCCRHPIPSQRTGSILPCIISIPQTSSSIRTTNTTTNSAAIHFASHLSSIATITCNIGHIIVSWNAICIIRWFTTWWKTQQVKDSWCHSWYGIRYFIILSIEKVHFA